MENITYLVTGASGHLGNTVVSSLIEKGRRVRALLLPGDKAKYLEPRAEVFRGDVRDMASMRPFFDTGGESCVVIHCAGIVTIASSFMRSVYEVNVEGTKNVIALCKEYGAQRLVYISSVHAIPEKPKGSTITETEDFKKGEVSGLYSETKAEATEAVLQAGREGLDVCVVHPSGMLGPSDYTHGHITQLIIDYCRGKLPAAVTGGYDFADVRDVAEGIISCADKGKNGECYILSNKYVSIPELLDIIRSVSGAKKIRAVFPTWFARLFAPLAEAYCKLKKRPALFTRYSLSTLMGNSKFSHAKADRELGYRTRPIKDTVKDTYFWLRRVGLV